MGFEIEKWRILTGYLFYWMDMNQITYEVWSEFD